jgi:hypothetical protein
LRVSERAKLQIDTLKATRRTLTIALLGGVLLLRPVCASAQLVAPTEAAPVQVGAVSLYPKLRIIDAGRDDNIFNDGTSPRGDYTLTASSTVLAVVKLGSNELLLSSSGDYTWFKQFRSERSNNGHYGARLNLAASRFNPFIGGMRTVAQSRPNAEIDTRARRIERTATAGLEFDVSERTAITASVQLDDSIYQPGESFRGVDLANALNRRRHTLSGGMRYVVTPFTTLAIAGNFAQDLFTESHLRDARSYSIGPTLEFNPEAMIHGRLMTGFQLFRPADAALPEHKGVVLAAALNWTLFGRTIFGVQATRNVGYSYLDTAPYYLATGTHFDVTQPLFGPISLLGNADWTRLSYDWADKAVENAGRVDVTRRGAGGVGITFRRGLSFNVMVERTQRRSNTDLRQNYQGTRFVGSVTVGS